MLIVDCFHVLLHVLVLMLRDVGSELRVAHPWSGGHVACLAASVAMDASRESISCCVMSDVMTCVLLHVYDGASDDAWKR